jgi:isocitrate dehydrogenase
MQMQLIRTYATLTPQVSGCDLYLDTTLAPAAIADEMQRAALDTPFQLTLLSNRGTQVWPTGSVYTECVDYLRARFELKKDAAPGSVGPSRAVALMNKVSEKFTVCGFELLRTFDGVKGYSMAQGQ